MTDFGKLIAKFIKVRELRIVENRYMQVLYIRFGETRKARETQEANKLYMDVEGDCFLVPSCSVPKVY